MISSRGRGRSRRSRRACTARQVNDSLLHLIFKPASRFTEAACDDAGLVIEIPGQWTLDAGYIDLDGDEADLRDFLGQDGEDFWWVCFYTWDTD